MMSFNVFSQKDTTQVVIKSETARLVIKDLITGDAAKLEVILLRSKISLLENKITFQSSIIKDLENQKINYLFIIDNQSKQLEYSYTINSKLQKDLKKYKTKNKILSFGGGAAIIILGVLVATSK